MTRMHLALALLSSVASTPLAAQTRTVSDPVGDFNVPFYVGVQDAGLDVTSFTVSFDGTDFTLGATMAGDIDPTLVGGLYVIGVDVGGSANPGPFANIGNPNVIFNRVIVLNGQTEVATLSGTTLTADITGDTFTVTVPVSLFGSTPLNPLEYGFNLWPRVGVGNNNQIADFAPDNAVLRLVPEPATWMTMLLGFGLVGMAMRRRRRPQFAAA